MTIEPHLAATVDPPGVILARLRRSQRPRMSQERLGAIMGYARTAVSGAEHGENRSREFWTRADDALGAGGILVAAADRHTVTAAALTRAVDADVAVDERAAAARLHAAVLGMAAIPDDVVTTLESDAVHAALSYATSPPMILMRELETTRALAITALDRTRRPAAAARLMRVLAQLNGLAATTVFDLGRTAAAADHAHAAWQYADLAGDPDLQAWARSAQATVAFWTGNAAAGLAFAEDGLTVARGHGAARLHAIAARAHALLGEDRAARANLDAAQGTIDGDVPGISGELVFGKARLALCSAAVSVAIGDGAAAVRYAHEALDADQAAPVQARRFAVEAAARMELAAAHLVQDNPEALEPIVAPALAIEPARRTMRLARRVAGLDRRLAAAPSSSTGTVRDMRARIAHFRNGELPPGPPATGLPC